jgi:hypothetical protein
LALQTPIETLAMYLFNNTQQRVTYINIIIIINNNNTEFARKHEIKERPELGEIVLNRRAG